MSQSPIDIEFADVNAGETLALDFANYDKVKIIRLGNQQESYDGKGDRIENGTLKNNGHTAVEFFNLLKTT